MPNLTLLDTPRSRACARARKNKLWPGSMWKDSFIVQLSTHGIVGTAARAVNRTRQCVYLERKKDEKFAEAWREAIEIVCDMMEAEVAWRGIHGTPKAVYYKGRIVGYHTIYHDNLLLAFLRPHRP